MMIFASLLVTGVLAAGQHATPPQPQRVGQPRPAGQPQTGRPEDPRSTGERPHTLGVGGSMMVSSRGASGGFRYFFSERVGINLAAGWSPNGMRSSLGSTTIVVPSVMVMLTKPHDTGQIDIRPYVGGGVTYIYSSGANLPTIAPGTSTAYQNHGTGVQVFGGAEISFSDMKRFTISAEGTYYTVPANFVSTPNAGGFNYAVAFHIYLK